MLLIYTGEQRYHTFIHHSDEEQDEELAKELYEEIKSIDDGYRICITCEPEDAERKSSDESINLNHQK